MQQSVCCIDQLNPPSKEGKRPDAYFIKRVSKIAAAMSQGTVAGESRSRLLRIAAQPPFAFSEEVYIRV